MLLKNGDTGIQVKYLQQGLKIMCCNPGSIDSAFGPGTQAAVEKFQEEWGLTVDGIVGNDTWNCLLAETNPAGIKKQRVLYRSHYRYCKGQYL